MVINEIIDHFLTDLEWCCKFTATKFELLYNIAYFFKPMNVSMWLSLAVWYYLLTDKYIHKLLRTKTVMLGCCAMVKIAVFFMKWEDTIHTRKVALSNSKTSSASIMLPKFAKLFSSACTLGISWYTIEDQAYNYKLHVHTFRMTRDTGAQEILH